MYFSTFHIQEFVKGVIICTKKNALGTMHKLNVQLIRYGKHPNAQLTFSTTKGFFLFPEIYTILGFKVIYRNA